MALCSIRYSTGWKISSQRAAPRAYIRPHASRAAKTVAFKETDSVKDWRVRKMINMSHSYFHDVWSKGDITLCDNILDDEFVHKENIWHPNRLIVGPHAFKRFVEECRTVYPDLNIEVQQVAVSDANHVFVLWQGSGTNLSPVQQGAKASFHESHMTGVDVITFNKDRSKILEVSVFRRPLHEEREQIMHEGCDQNQPEIHLRRLHFDGAEESKH